MIGKLRGRIDEIEDGHVLIDVGGVGYMLEVSQRLASRLETGRETVLFTHMLVREDAIRLFGFESAEERAWFRLLQNVQGVGAKIALAILSTLGISDLIQAIAQQDSFMLARAHGVGPKLAKRIVSELKDKAPAIPIRIAHEAAPAGVRTRADAISALVNLGLSQPQAMSAVDASLARLGEAANVEDLIREGLKAIG